MSAAAQPTTPRLGDLCPDQGGLYAGMMRGEAGQADYHITKVGGELAQLRGALGVRGKDVPGAYHRRDGLANTQAMAAAGHKIAKQLLAAGCYIASLAEAQLCAANLYEEFPVGYHWTSTRDSAYYAWVRDFEYGGSYVTFTDIGRPFVVLRRSTLCPFAPLDAPRADVGTAVETAEAAA